MDKLDRPADHARPATPDYQHQDPLSAPASLRGLIHGSRLSSAWSDPRNNYEQSAHAATLDPRHAIRSAEHPSCSNQPAPITLTAHRQRHAHR